MKLRHVTALALVGWYLMTPPFSWNPKSGYAVRGSVNVKASLSEWVSANKIFDSLPECQKARDDQISFCRGQALPVRSDIDRNDLCVRTDDPRLPK
jgi:hypothetical protein